jgi:hypothetical protein
MKEDQPRASWSVRLAAFLCLGSVIFAAVRIIGSHGYSSFWDFWRDPPYYPKYMIGLMLPFGLFASIYIMLTGRIPSTSRCPVKLDGNPCKTRFDKIGLTVIWTATGAFCVAVLYMIMKMEI